jgi:ectoine hydroxylase-related dioxygenase (phytanoyl-CoA dioxygenase family)
MAATDLAYCDAVERYGYAVVANVVPASRVDDLLEYLNSATIKHSRAGARHLMRDGRIASFANLPLVKKFAIDVLGDGAIPFRATLFDKSPDANWLVVWHQDTALPLEERFEISGWASWSMKEGIHYAHAPAWALEQVLALRVALDDSNLTNGPLRVLPGTHRHGVLGDDELLELASAVDPVDCIVGCGGIVAIRPLIVHASSKSTSELPRRVLRIEYAAEALVKSGIRLAIA